MNNLFDYFKQKIGVTNLEGELLKTNSKVENVLKANVENLTDINAEIRCINDLQDIIATDLNKQSGKLKEINDRLKIRLIDSDFEKLMDSKYITAHLYYTKRYIFNKETKVTLPVTDFIKDWDCLPTFNSLNGVCHFKCKICIV